MNPPDNSPASKRAVRLAAAALALGLVAAACGSDDESSETNSTGASADSVTIYSGRNEELIQPILDDFSDETGIKVNVKYGDSADLALLIEEESAANSTQADVFLSQSPGSLGFLEQDGRLAALPASTLELVPETVRDENDRWIGFSGRQRVLVYNTDLIDETDLPSSVFALTDPEWNDKIGVAPSNGSFQDFVTAMRSSEGDDVTTEWLEGLAANDPVSYPKNSAIVAAVGRGEVEVGLVNHYYNHRALEEDPNQPSANHQFAPGDPGAVLIVTGAAIIEGTDRADVAAQLIDYLLSPAGQQYFATETFEYPLAIGEEPPAVVEAVEFADVSGFSYSDLGGGLEQTRIMIADAGLEG
ncbi:MAG: extracellular solute-binding protein [Actinobacteria bacterium]|nr:extracellular solute-binding protein [Actinomycetota bacterium]